MSSDDRQPLPDVVAHGAPSQHWFRSCAPPSKLLSRSTRRVAGTTRPTRPTPARQARVGERRRPDLYRVGARQHHLDRVVARGHASHADDRQIREPRRGNRRQPAPRSDGWPDPTPRRRPLRAAARRVSGSIAMPSSGVHQRDGLGAGGRRRVRRPRRAGRCSGSASPTGAGRRPPSPPITSAVAHRDRGRRGARPPSRFGQHRFTSTATTSGGAAARSSAARRYSSTVRPQIDATTVAPVATQRRQLVARARPRRRGPGGRRS